METALMRVDFNFVASDLIHSYLRVLLLLWIKAVLLPIIEDWPRALIQCQTRASPLFFPQQSRAPSLKLCA